MPFLKPRGAALLRDRSSLLCSERLAPRAALHGGDLAPGSTCLVCIEDRQRTSSGKRVNDERPFAHILTADRELRRSSRCLDLHQ